MHDRDDRGLAQLASHNVAVVVYINGKLAVAHETGDSILN